MSVSRYSFRLVLIETLWNVKIENYDRMEDWTGINRNIVECKVKNCEMKRLYVHCINRNIVECKVEVYNVADLVRLRINRNIVECKENFGISEKPVETGINRNIVECKVGIALTCLECSG